MPVVGAAVAVFAERAAEFADHDHNRVVPAWAHFVGEGAQPLAELLQSIRQVTGRCALPDVGVPAAHVQERDIELLVHQVADPACLQLETLRAERPARGVAHLGSQLLHHLLAHAEAVADRRRQLRVRVHAGDQRALARIDRGLAHRAQREIGDLTRPAHRQGHLVREGDRLGPGQPLHQPVHETGLEVARAGQRLAHLDAVLGFEVAARLVVRAGERHQRELLRLVQPVQVFL